MKIVVTLAIDLDPEDWTLNYGIEGAKAIREDVKSHVQNMVFEQMNTCGVTATVVAR